MFQNVNTGQPRANIWTHSMACQRQKCFNNLTYQPNPDMLQHCLKKSPLLITSIIHLLCRPEWETGKEVWWLNKLAKARKMRKPSGTLSLKKFGLGNLWVEKVWTQNTCILATHFWKFFWSKSFLGQTSFLGQQKFWVKKSFRINKVFWVKKFF